MSSAFFGMMWGHACTAVTAGSSPARMGAAGRECHPCEDIIAPMEAVSGWHLVVIRTNMTAVVVNTHKASHSIQPIH